MGSEQIKLIGSGGRAIGVTSFDQAMGGNEQVEMAGVTLDALGEAGGGEELVEGVADVFQLGVEIIAVAAEKVLEALEQIGWKIGARGSGIAMGGDRLETILDEGVITLRGTSQTALVEPGGGPGERVEQALAVSVIMAGPAGVEAQANGEQQFFGGGGERIGGGRDGGHGCSLGLGAQPALGRLGLGAEDLEVEFVVESLQILVTSGDEQIVGHVQEQAQIAGGVFTEGLLQAGG